MRFKLAIIFLTAACLAGCAKNAKITRPSVTATAAEPEKIGRPEAVFTAGEKLTYVIAWKGIPIGSATALVEALTELDGFQVYKIVVKASTNDFLSRLFPVHDTYTSYVDRNTLTSRRYEAVLSEGRYKKDLVVSYDSDKCEAIYKNERDGSAKTCPIAREARDPVCAAYYFRTMPLAVGEEKKISVNLCENNYELVGRVEKKSRVNLSELGDFNAYLIKPYIILKGKKQKRAKAWGYVSDDKNRCGLYMAVRVLEIPWIGEITATLKKVEYESSGPGQSQRSPL